MKISSTDAGRRLCYSMPLRNDSRRDTAKGVLAETAAATAAKVTTVLLLFLHPICTDRNFKVAFASTV